jgi:hypothetical protein
MKLTTPLPSMCRKVDNFTAICEPTVCTWQSRRLSALWTSRASYSESSTSHDSLREGNTVNVWSCTTCTLQTIPALTQKSPCCDSHASPQKVVPNLWQDRICEWISSCLSNFVFHKRSGGKDNLRRFQRSRKRGDGRRQYIPSAALNTCRDSVHVSVSTNRRAKETSNSVQCWAMQNTAVRSRTSGTTYTLISKSAMWLRWWDCRLTVTSPVAQKYK